MIGTDANGFITLPNQAAGELLGIMASELIGQRLLDVAPEMQELLGG